MTESLLILNIYVEVVRSNKPVIPGGVKAVVNRNIHRFWESCLQRSRRHKGQTPWLPLQTLRIELASQSPCCFSYFKYKTEGGMEEGGKKAKKTGRRRREERRWKKERRRGRRRKTMVLGCTVDDQSLSPTLAVDLRMRRSTSPKWCTPGYSYMHPHKWGGSLVLRSVAF